VISKLFFSADLPVFKFLLVGLILNFNHKFSTQYAICVIYAFDNH